MLHPWVWGSHRHPPCSAPVPRATPSPALLPPANPPAHSCTHQPTQCCHWGPSPRLAPLSIAATASAIHPTDPAAPRHRPPTTAHPSTAHGHGATADGGHWHHPGSGSPILPAPQPSSEPGSPAGPGARAAYTHPRHTSPPWWAATGPWPAAPWGPGPCAGRLLVPPAALPRSRVPHRLVQTSASSTRSWALQGPTRPPCTPPRAGAGVVGTEPRGPRHATRPRARAQAPAGRDGAAGPGQSCGTASPDG